MTLCHNCHRPAVAVVVLDQCYQLGRCCWSEPKRPTDDRPPRSQAVKPKQRQGQH